MTTNKQDELLPDDVIAELQSIIYNADLAHGDRLQRVSVRLDQLQRQRESLSPTTGQGEAVPVYKEGTKLHEMLSDQVMRDLQDEQILSECQASGFVIDASLIQHYRDDLNDGIERGYQDHLRMEGANTTPLPTSDRELLEGALARMDNARRILTDNDPRPECNWGMLDTSDIRSLISTTTPSDEVKRLDKWTPTDEEVLAWNERHDDKFRGNIQEARCAIDDARSMHNLAALSHKEEAE